MVKKYVCEIKKDHNELELIHNNNFGTNTQQIKKGTIQFDDREEMNKYLNQHCISVDSLENSSNNIFMFLFFILLLILMVTLICQMFNKSGMTTNVTKTSSFGRFSF